jgi:hypothetical protein
MRHISAVDPTPFFAKYSENVWAGLKGYLDEIARTAAAADVFTESVAFQVMQSIRLDLGYGSWVHP